MVANSSCRPASVPPFLGSENQNPSAAPAPPAPSSRAPERQCLTCSRGSSGATLNLRSGPPLSGWGSRRPAVPALRVLAWTSFCRNSTSLRAGIPFSVPACELGTAGSAAPQDFVLKPGGQSPGQERSGGRTLHRARGNARPHSRGTEARAVPQSPRKVSSFLPTSGRLRRVPCEAHSSFLGARSQHRAAGADFPCSPLQDPGPTVFKDASSVEHPHVLTPIPFLLK